MNAPRRSAAMPAYWPSERLLDEADLQRIEGVALAERGLPQSTYAMLMDGCAIDPDKVAMRLFRDGARPRETETSVSFAELRRKVHQTANLLHALGVAPTDVVSMLMPAVPQTQFVSWGAQAAGVLNPVNWMLEPEILASAFEAAGTVVIAAWSDAAHADLWAKLERVVPRLPRLRAVLRVADPAEPGPAPQAIAGVPVLDYAAEVERHDGERLLSGRQIAPDDTATLFHTGGTTGTPKLARSLHRNQVFQTWAIKHLTGLDEREVRLVGVPVFHVAGLITGCFSPLARGGSLVFMTAAGYRHPSVLPNLWRIVEAYRATAMTVVPTLVNQLLSVPVAGADLSSLNYITSSTAPLSVHAARAFHAQTGQHVHECYGMTEATAVVTQTPRGGRVKVGSSGIRLPYGGVRVVRLASAGSIERDCQRGEPGTILIRGPGVFAGYLGAEAAAARLDGDWFDTGDLGYLDDEGWLWVTGRAKDLIIRGGHNIDPKMVEEVLYQHPAVQDAAVVGTPDAHAGEVPIAYVVLKPGARADADEILRHAAAHTPERAAVPKQCVLLDQLPKTQVGKILKVQLRLDAVERGFRTLAQRAAGAAGAELVQVQARDHGPAGLRVELVVRGNPAQCEAVQQALRSLPVPFVINPPTETLHG